MEVTTPEGKVELLTADTMILALGFKPLKNVPDSLNTLFLKPMWWGIAIK